MSKPQERSAEPPDNVTYVVVVHGMGEQRKNECVINVVNRFAEARRGAKEDDNRDVLTLGKASAQTGLSKVPVTEQPWIEFEGIPASPNAPTPSEPFLGEPATCGKNLRFVDICWSDVTRDPFKHVGQDVSLWAKGLLGRLLRKHEAAEKAAEKAETEQATQDAEDARVPFWIRRILHLLIDTLLLVRFAMTFRFKEMKELVFVKFLGDVQLYGEYDRCRGQAVRRFHEMMAKVEAAHYAREPAQRKPRPPRYVIIAHSLGSIMSLDALLYASATSDVQRGGDLDWHFPGYLRDDDKKRESRKEGRFALLDTSWIQRVQSFVTLGSPIDKYLTIWWLNYRYLLKSDDRLRPRKQPKIRHFNYCDELDPVGHNLDVVQETPVYEAVFEKLEDVVFNRYSVPGVAHNTYWTDQSLFRWILHWAVDSDGRNAPKPPKEPRWFRPWAYWKMLFWLYSLIPLIVLLGTYGSLSLVFQLDGWRTAALAAAVFSFLVYVGSRLIDLSIWWRQIQRKKSIPFWKSCRPDKQQRKSRNRGGVVFWGLAFTAPLACAVLTCVAWHKFTGRFSEIHESLWSAPLPPCSSESCAVRLLVVLTVFVVVGLVVARRRLPIAYRVPAHDPRYRTKVETAAMLVSGVAALVFALLLASRFACPSLAASIAAEPTYRLPTAWLGQLTLLGIVATAVYGYRLYRFLAVKHTLHPGRPEKVDYRAYAGGTSSGDGA